MVDSKKNTKESASFEVLEKAEKGKVVTRFPPEPSGYLHIGHIKAAFLNSHLANLYEGRMLLRFDDTNPEKESDEFAQAIIRDVEALGIKFDGPDYMTNYFGQLEEIMTDLIKKGHIYADNTPKDQMRDDRDKGNPSKNREQKIEETLELWAKMRDPAVTEDSPIREYCLRARIDYKDNNKCMRDPVFYRFCFASHYRIGTKHKVYPTYDFACPIIDHLEGITHMMRTNEYADRIPMYRWLEKVMGYEEIQIYEYARLNMVHTILSKRNLKWFVENKKVEGWNDPRFPTLRGILRRGVTPDALKDFMLSIGPSKAAVLMRWDKLFQFNRQRVDPTAKRLFMVNKQGAVPVTILNFDDGLSPAEVNWHPKNEDLGKRQQIRSKDLLIEKEDAQGLELDSKLTLYKWGNCRVADLKKEGDQIVGLSVKLTPEDQDFKKTKVAHWVPAGSNVEVTLVEFDHLIVKEKMDEKDNIEDLYNPDSRIESIALAEVNVSGLQQGQVVQFERRGFYYLDKAQEDGQKAVFHFVPDGSAKNMSIVETKLNQKALTQGKNADFKRVEKMKKQEKNAEKEKEKKEKKKDKKKENENKEEGNEKK